MAYLTPREGCCHSCMFFRFSCAGCSSPLFLRDKKNNIIIIYELDPLFSTPLKSIQSDGVLGFWGLGFRV